jgi:ADP-ribosyl-[dinitrogen reductase] hydrolase
MMYRVAPFGVVARDSEVSMHAHLAEQAGKFSLFIDSVTVPGTGGVIGMTSCPGKQDDFFFEPSLSRLEADVKTISTWGATVLVTLMEEVELHILQITNLPEKLAEYGIRWIHLPIRNRSLPTTDFEMVWSVVGEELRSILRKGGRIVIHCQEGVGRTGLIAARLLIEMGVKKDDAISIVRNARVGALETWPHENYCNSIRPAA